MPDRYPGYDVLQKRNSPSWNDKTRAVIDRRMAIDADHHAFFTDQEWPTMRAICDRIVPQPPDRLHPAPVRLRTTTFYFPILTSCCAFQSHWASAERD